MSGQKQVPGHNPSDSQHEDKPTPSMEQYEHDVDSYGNLVYENSEEEPELHARTYLALSAMFLLNLVQVFALQGPPAVVCSLLLPDSTAC